MSTTSGQPQGGLSTAWWLGLSWGRPLRLWGWVMGAAVRLLCSTSSEIGLPLTCCTGMSGGRMWWCAVMNGRPASQSGLGT